MNLRVVGWVNGKRIGGLNWNPKEKVNINLRN